MVFSTGCWYNTSCRSASRDGSWLCVYMAVLKSRTAREKALDSETHTHTRRIPAWFMKYTDTRGAFVRVGTHGKGQAEAGAFSMSCTTKQRIHQTNSHTPTDVSPVRTPARWTTQHCEHTADKSTSRLNQCLNIDCGSWLRESHCSRA